MIALCHNQFEMFTNSEKFGTIKKKTLTSFYFCGIKYIGQINVSINVSTMFYEDNNMKIII